VVHRELNFPERAPFSACFISALVSLATVKKKTKKKQPTNQTKKNIPQLQSRSLHEGDKKKAMIKAKSCMNVWKGVC